MKPPGHPLARLIALARRTTPAPADPPAPGDVPFFAQRTVSEWNRRRARNAAPDALCLWERVGNWSLAVATVALILVVALRPEPPPPNPFDVFGPVDADETSLF